MLIIRQTTTLWLSRLIEIYYLLYAVSKVRLMGFLKQQSSCSQPATTASPSQWTGWQQKDFLNIPFGRPFIRSMFQRWLKSSLCRLVPGTRAWWRWLFHPLWLALLLTLPLYLMPAGSAPRLLHRQDGCFPLLTILGGIRVPLEIRFYNKHWRWHAAWIRVQSAIPRQSGLATLIILSLLVLQ